jgi:hypothetical protein
MARRTRVALKLAWLTSLALLLAATTAACGGDDDGSASDSTVDRSPSVTRDTSTSGDVDGGGSTTGDADGGGATSGDADGRGPSTTSRSDGAVAPAGQHRSISFEDLWNDRASLIDQPVSVEAKVFYRLDCASMSAGGPPCTATGFVVGRDTEDLPLYGENKAFPLWIDGHAVTCGTSTLSSDFQCEGWRHNAPYTLKGSVQRLVLGGRQTDELGFVAD